MALCLAVTYQTRTIRLVGEQQRETAINALRHLPVRKEKPLEVVIREEKPTRGLDANALMWAGPLKDIAEQAWVGGRQYTVEVWHEAMKRFYLPEESDEGYERMVKDGYRKWDFLPTTGDPVLVGSTTQLTKFGFSVYLQKIEAHGASLGVMFTERRAA